MKYLFYLLDNTHTPKEYSLDGRYFFRLWHPTCTQVVPSSVPRIPFAIWWLFHYAHVFVNRDYCLGLVYRDDILVHRSGVFPGYFRFPFMRKYDLQIGDTWTSPDHRGQGLATFAVQEIVNYCRKPGRRFWYLVDSENLPSIRVIEKAGFRKVGEGLRVPRFGISFLGHYIMTQTELYGGSNE